VASSTIDEAIDLGQGQIASARALVGSIAPATNDADFDAASISTLSASAELQSSEDHLREIKDSGSKAEVEDVEKRIAVMETGITAIVQNMKKVEDQYSRYKPMKEVADTGDIIVVTVRSKMTPISSTLYGAFFEEINFAGEGGLYAELIRNRDFEQLGRGSVTGEPGPMIGHEHEYTAPKIHVKSFAPWLPLNGTGCDSVIYKTDHESAPFPTNPVSLHIQVPSDTDCARVGILNPGYWGINVVAGRKYQLSFYARSNRLVQLSPALQTPSGSIKLTSAATIIVPASGEWAKYSIDLDAEFSSEKGVFSLVFDPGQGPVQGMNGTLDESVDLWLDNVSLFPDDAVEGLFRKDILDKIKALRPAYLRFPGGNFLEGYDWDSHWHWKKALGQPEARPGHYNAAWGYWTNDGLGLYEFLILCEALGAEPQMSVFTGYFMGHYVPVANSSRFAQDALDAVEFANGMEGYGALRMEMGHPASFDLNRMEVGNEELDMVQYRSHYDLISGALWEEYPEIIIIASGRWGAPMSGHPCLAGSRCNTWDDHVYRLPDDMASMSMMYDEYDRTAPSVCVGEYAARPVPQEPLKEFLNEGVKQSLRAALAEAIFMSGFERNADVVKCSSFAPMLARSEGTQWQYTLMTINSSFVIPTPSYHVQHLFGAVGRGDFHIESTVTPSWLHGEKPVEPVVVASVTTTSDQLKIKIVNYNQGDVKAEINLDDEISIANGTMKMIVLSAHHPDAENTQENPDTVTPFNVDVAKAFYDGKCSVVLEPWSLTIIQVDLLNDIVVTSAEDPSEATVEGSAEAHDVQMHADIHAAANGQNTDVRLVSTDASGATNKIELGQVLPDPSSPRKKTLKLSIPAA